MIFSLKALHELRLLLGNEIIQGICIFVNLSTFKTFAHFFNLTSIQFRLIYNQIFTNIGESESFTWEKTTCIKGVLHLWALFLKTLCIFSKNKATSDKVSYGSGQKCSKELENYSFTSVETIVVKLQ